jgi:hypothetical protein
MAKLKKPPAVKAGDVLIAKLPDGRFTAVRVLRTIGKSSLLSTSPYLRRSRPSLNDPLLRKVVMQKRFFFKGDVARVWIDGKPPNRFEFLGNLPLTTAEKRIRCETYGGGWGKLCGSEAFLEWRWLHDRPAFEAEVRGDRAREEKQSRVPGKPKKMMSEKGFWSIVDLLDWKDPRRDQKVMAPATNVLASRSKREICQFEERLAYLLYRLDTKAHAGSTSDNPHDPNYISADGFLYARCAVVASGKRFYEAVLKRPAKMPPDADFEALLSLATDAYESKTGNDLDYTTGCNYESFSNPKGWK